MPAREPNDLPLEQTPQNPPQNAQNPQNPPQKQDSERKKMLRGVLKTAALGGAAYGAYKLINKYGAIPPSLRGGSLSAPKAGPAALRAPSVAKTYAPGNSTINLRPFDRSTLGQGAVPKPKSVIVPVPITKRSTWYQPAARPVPKDIAKRMPAAGNVIPINGPQYQGVVPQGRNTVDRLAKAAQLKKTRAYDALKPLSKPEQRRLGKLIPGQVDSLARVQREAERIQVPGIATATERQTARQKLQLYRTAHLGSTPTEREAAQQAIRSQFPRVAQPVTPARSPVMPQGRGSVERLARAAQLRTERGYGGLKPFGKVEQRNLRGLDPKEVARLNKLQAAASGGKGAPKTAAAKQKARQRWQIHRTAALGSAADRAVAQQKINEGKLLEAVLVSARMFDNSAPNWDVRDERGRSARVFAPGARPRERREKYWHEKSENQRKIAAAAVVGSLLAGNAMGWKMRGLHQATSNVGDAIKTGVKAATHAATKAPAAAASVAKETLPSFADNIIDGGFKKAMSARVRLREFGGGQQFIGEDGRFLHPLKAATGYQKAYVRDASGGKSEVDIPLAHGQVLRSVYNTAKTANKYAGRGGGLLKDTASVIRGEPRQKDQWGRVKKREWEKPWFNRAANAAMTTGGLLLAAHAVKRGQDPRSALHPYVKTGENLVKSTVKKVNQYIPNAFT
jgi:hypothetical protein